MADGGAGVRHGEILRLHAFWEAIRPLREGRFRAELQRTLAFVRQGDHLLWSSLVLLGGLGLGITILLAVTSAFPPEFSPRGDEAGLIANPPPHIKAAELFTYSFGIILVGIVALVVWLTWLFYGAIGSRLVRGKIEQLLTMDALCHLPLLAAVWASYRAPDSAFAVLLRAAVTVLALKAGCLLVLRQEKRPDGVLAFLRSPGTLIFPVLVALSGAFLGLALALLAHLWGTAVPVAGWLSLLLVPLLFLGGWIGSSLALARGSRRPVAEILPTFTLPYLFGFLTLLAPPLAFVPRAPGVIMGVASAGFAVTTLFLIAAKPSLGKESAARILRGALDYAGLPILVFLYAFHPRFFVLTRLSNTLLKEHGQDLAWAHRIIRGQLPGQDMYLLYGPFREYIYALAFRFFGTSLGVFHATRWLLYALGLVVFYLAARMLLRSRAMALLLVVLVPSLGAGLAFFRVGLGLLPLVFLLSWLRWRRPGLILGGGLAAGFSILLSQEVGISVTLAGAVLLLALGGGWRVLRGRLLTYALGTAAVGLPLLAYYLFRGAGWGFLELFSYPTHVASGFMARPFPSPPPPPGPHLAELLEFLSNFRGPLRWYFPPLIYTATGVVLLTALVRGSWSREKAALASLVTFGALLFRSALGRSDETHLSFASPPALILLGYGLERLCFRLRDHVFSFSLSPSRRMEIPLILAVLAVSWSIIGYRGLISGIDESLDRYLQAPPAVQPVALDRASGVKVPAGALDSVVEVVRYVRSRTHPEEPVLFLPDDAALYFLTDRLNPTRFDLSFTMVVDKYRKEAWEAIKRAQPQLVVLNTSPDRFIRDELQFPQLLEFLRSRYAFDRLTGDFLILRHVGPFSGRLRSIPSSGWVATASVQGEHAPKAFDRDHTTRWVTRVGQEPGMWFRVDLGGRHRIQKICLVTGQDRFTMPRALKVEVSLDGARWEEVSAPQEWGREWMGLLTHPAVTSTMLTVAFRPVLARHVRMTLGGPHSKYPWSVTELFVYEEGEEPRSLRARETFWRALEMELDHAGPERWRGVFSAYREALELDPDLAEAHQRLTVLEERLGVPEAPPDERGLAFARHQIWEEAMPPLEQAWAQSPRPIRGALLQQLATAHERVGAATRAAAVREALGRLGPALPLRAAFGSRLRLLGVDLQAGSLRPGDRIRVGSVWQALRSPGQDYHLILDLQSRRTRVRVVSPLGEPYLTGRWQKGEVIREETVMTLPRDLPPGHYRMLLSLQRSGAKQSVGIWRLAVPPFSWRLEIGRITVRDHA